MLNWWLIVLIVVLPLICIALGIYTLFYYQSEEDDSTAYGGKIVFVIGIIVSLGSILLIPYDVANSPDPTSGVKYYNTLDTQLMWTIVLWVISLFAIVISPFAMFYYEAYDPDKNKPSKQVASAALMTLAVFAAFSIITGVCYSQIGNAVVPYVSYSAEPQFVDVFEPTGLVFNTTGVKTTVKIGVSFTTYCFGMVCFCGWIAFFFYGGCGLVACPIFLIRGFLRRPKRINAHRFTQEMAVCLAKADALLEMSLRLQKECRGAVSRNSRSKINIIRNETYFLEAQQDQLIWAFTKAGGSPFIVYGKLLIGIFCAGLAIAWSLHIFLYNTFAVLPFLNTILIQLDSAFSLLGILAYGIFSFYLIWATFQGQIALGLRLLFFQIHPMKKHDTLLNSLLFNVTLLLLTSVAVIQFSARSFQAYAPRTAINALMNVYVLQLQVIGVIIRWAQFLFLGMSLVSVLWLALCPRSKKIDTAKIKIDA